ncbi:MAG: hypothetical protein RSD78_09650 [Oscillospiraceae bacterium]
MAYIQYLKFSGTVLPLPDFYDLDLADVEADSGGETEMYITGYKAKLYKDTSYKSLWTVSFTLNEF